MAIPIYTVLWYCVKDGVEGPAGPAIAVPLFLAVRNAGALFHCIIEPRPFLFLCMMSVAHAQDERSPT